LIAFSNAEGNQERQQEFFIDSIVYKKIKGKQFELVGALR
jgi:hypothetical protein